MYVGFNPNDGHANPMGGYTFQWVTGNGYDREKDNFDEITSFTAMSAGGGSVWSIPVGGGNSHYNSIKSLYDSGKLQILEPGEQPKFSDIAQDYLNIDGQNLYTDFTFDLLTSDTAVVDSDVVDDASPDSSLYFKPAEGFVVKSICQ